MALNVGTRLGPYSVTAKIGEGGMGEVYQARDTKFDRDVALKVLPEAFTSDPDRLARFEREAKVLASLNHPNIGSIYGLEEAEGVKALVLELVEGPTLADRIKQGPIPLDEALPIAKQIAEALEAAHEQGVIHRDLKPANIKVKDDGTVKVLDFGLAKAFQPDASDPNMSMSRTISLTAAATQMGMVIGTAAYMSPEQASGKTVDKRADVWAFGVVLYEMLTGTRPFIGDDVSKTLANVIAIDPDWSALPKNVPPVLGTFLRGCLEKNPKKRIRDIGDVSLAMEGAFETTPAAPAEPLVAPRLHLWQRPVPALLVVLLAAVMTGLAGWSLRPSGPRAVTRFAYDMPASHQLSNRNRAVLAVSPDGRRFVYNTTEGLYLRTLDALEATLLPGTGGSTRTPVFSVDGQSLAYFTVPDQLTRLALSGGAPVLVTGGVGGVLGMSWAADDTIFFSQTAGIMRVAATGGTPKVSPATVNRGLNIVRGCLSRAVEWGHLNVSPVKTVRPYHVENVRTRILSTEEIQRVLDACSEDLRLIARATLESLFRVSEVLNLRAEDIGPSFATLIHNKSGRMRRIPLTPTLRTDLIARTHRSGWVFGQDRYGGRPPKQGAVSIAFCRVMHGLGLHDASHHTLRHTGTSAMVAAGVSLRVVQEIGGWTSLRMLERYAHPTGSELRQAVRTLSELTTGTKTGTAAANRQLRSGTSEERKLVVGLEVRVGVPNGD